MCSSILTRPETRPSKPAPVRPPRQARMNEALLPLSPTSYCSLPTTVHNLGHRRACGRTDELTHHGLVGCRCRHGGERGVHHEEAVGPGQAAAGPAGVADGRRQRVTAAFTGQEACKLAAAVPRQYEPQPWEQPSGRHHQAAAVRRRQSPAVVRRQRPQQRLDRHPVCKTDTSGKAGKSLRLQCPLLTAGQSRRSLHS